MSKKFDIRLNKFKPGEAAEITGVSTVKQLDWRRRGFLPAHPKGHARFNVFGLAYLRLLQMASESRILLERFAPAARQAAINVAYYGLWFSNTYEGTHSVLEEFTVTSNEPNRKVLLSANQNPDEVRRFMIVWSEEQAVLDELLSRLGSSFGYNAKDVDGTAIEYTDSLDKAYQVGNEIGKDISASGRFPPANIFDLRSIGFYLGVGHEKPFVHLSLKAEEPPDRPEQRGPT